MSRVDTLIAQLCPDGIRFEPLAKIGDWYGGGTPSKDKLEYWQDGTIPWVSPKDMGKPIIDATEDYITEAAIKGSATKLVPANSVAVVVRSSILDRILPIALIPIPVALNQDMKAVVPREGILSSYVAYLLRSRGPELLRVARKTGGSVASIESSKLFSFRVPVPPIEIQYEVVKVLDALTKLEAELEEELKAELEARRQQYRYYRDSLLNFAEDANSAGEQRAASSEQRAASSEQRARITSLGEIGKFIRGRRFTKDDVVEDGIPSIHYGEIYTHYGVAAHSAISHVRRDMAQQLRYAQPGDVVIAGVGETVEDVGKAVAWLGTEEVAIHDDCFLFRHTMNPKFVSYYLQTEAFHAQKGKYVARAKVKRLSGESLAKITIPVPPAEEQERIVAILDKFDALVSDLSAGLPAEIKARRQQYEYYRDRLLTFSEAA
jgi:Restriction endonuclease S subunits